MKKVYVRCNACDLLAYVNYEGKTVTCPKCGAPLLTDNDSRIPEDYEEFKNGDVNVIGDSVDDFISQSDSKDMDELFGELVDMEERSHKEKVMKDCVDLEKSKYFDTVQFGDNFWKVLAVEGERRLLIARECDGFDIDFSYNENNELTYELEETWNNYDWKSCIYRRYLNDYYYNKTFSCSEKQRIIETSIQTEGLNGASELVKDKVFLLSKEEVEKYIPNIDDRKGKVFILYSEAKRPWLLRNTSKLQERPYIVSEDGEIEILPEPYVVDMFRPAIWIK